MMRGAWQATKAVPLLALLLIASGGFAYAQFGFGRGDSNAPARMAPKQLPDANFAV